MSSLEAAREQIWREEEKREGEDDHVAMEAVIGVRQPQAKECMSHQKEAESGQEGFSPRAFRWGEGSAHLTAGSWPPEL